MFRSVVIAMSLFSAAAFAHDLRVMGGKQVAKAGEEAIIYIKLGHTEAVQEVVEAKQIENFVVVSPSGSKTPLDKREGGSLHDAKIKLEEKGVFQVLANTTAETQTKIKGDDGRHRHMNGSKEEVKKKN